MARFAIKDAQTGNIKHVGCPKYNGAFGKVSFLEFPEISSPFTMAFSVGDYVDYPRTGLRYYLYSVPAATRNARTNARGNSIVYKSVKFYCKTQELTVTPFRDIVLNGAVHFSSASEVSTFEDVFGIARRIQANMDSFYGENVWRIECYEGDADVVEKMREPKSFSISDGSALDALNNIYTIWPGIGWVYNVVNGVNVVTIGRPNVQDSDNTTDIFAYGKGNGLKAVATSFPSLDDVATRIYAYGSDRNMPTRWYNGKHIYNPGSVFIPHLMIPIEQWGNTGTLPDARKAYVENASAMQMYGLMPKIIRFDGRGEYEEIYPSIEKMTFEDLRASQPDYLPSIIYSDDERVDEIKTANNPVDDGIRGDEGEKYKEFFKTNIHSQQEFFTIFEGAQNKTYTWNVNLGVTTTQTGKVFIDTTGFSFSISDITDIYVGANFTYEILIAGNVVFRGNVSPAVGDNYSLEANFGQKSFESALSGSVSIRATMSVELGPNHQNRLSCLAKFAISKQATLGIAAYMPATFGVTLKQIGFDITKQTATGGDGLGVIEMKTGNCAGRAFKILSCSYQEETDDWAISLSREEDSSLGQIFPNNIYQINAGDRYVITGIMMPDIYINASARRLYARAQELIAKLSEVKRSYTLEIDSKVIAESGERITEGMYMPVYDEDIIGSTVDYVLIDTLTIAENDSPIPKYSIVLRNEKTQGVLQRLSGDYGRNARRISIIENKSKSGDYQDAEDKSSNQMAPIVKILCDSPFFTYVSGSVAPLEDKISLTCKVENLPAVTFKWQYYVAESDTWSDIAGATYQSLDIVPTGAYFPTEINTARIRCIVNNDISYSASINIAKITGGRDGNTPYINPATGTWCIGSIDTGVKAEGEDGATPYINSGYWYINGQSTGVKAEGIDGIDGVDGKDGVSIVWKGSFAQAPDNPQNGWAYYNTVTKKSYTYRSGAWYQMTVDGIDGRNGVDGISIVWKGESATPPLNPQTNWAYRDTDNGRCYVYNGTAWALMVHDGSEGAARTQWEAIHGAANTRVLQTNDKGSYWLTKSAFGQYAFPTQQSTFVYQGVAYTYAQRMIVYSLYGLGELDEAYESLRSYLAGIGLYDDDPTTGFDRLEMSEKFRTYYDAEKRVSDRIVVDNRVKVDDLEYLKEALEKDEDSVTTIEGGLVLSKIVGVRNGNNMVAGLNSSDVGEDQTHGKVMVFAGADQTQPTADQKIANAAFRVYEDGRVVGKDIIVEGGEFRGRFMLPFVVLGGTGHTLQLTDSASIILGSGTIMDQTLILPESQDFNGWVLNVYCVPKISRADANGIISGRIHCPNKDVVSTGGLVQPYYASKIQSNLLAAFFQLICIGGEWVLQNAIGQEITYTKY